MLGELIQWKVFINGDFRGFLYGQDEEQVKKLAKMNNHTTDTDIVEVVNVKAQMHTK